MYMSINATEARQVNVCKPPDAIWIYEFWELPDGVKRSASAVRRGSSLSMTRMSYPKLGMRYAGFGKDNPYFDD